MKKNWIVSSLLFLVVGAITFHFFQIQRSESDLRDIRLIPMQIGEWTARNLKITEREYEILETENLFSREYQNPQGESMSLFVIYSETNRRVCHPPIVCLIGSGATVAKSTKETLSLSNQELPVNHLVTTVGRREYLVLYWYMLGKEFTNDYFTQQFRWVFKQMTHKGVGGALIRVITPISGTEEETLERAKRFVQELLPILTKEEV